MTYRDDAAALAARHATLQAELGQKQRELDEAALMLADARRVEQAASYFERAPELRRRQWRHLGLAAVVVVLVGGGALAAAASAAKQARQVEAQEQETRLVRIRSTLAARADAQRLQAELEALRVVVARPAADPDPRGARPATRLRRAAPVAPPASAAGEDER